MSDDYDSPDFVDEVRAWGDAHELLEIHASEPAANYLEGVGWATVVVGVLTGLGIAAGNHHLLGVAIGVAGASTIQATIVIVLARILKYQRATALLLARAVIAQGP